MSNDEMDINLENGKEKRNSKKYSSKYKHL